MNSVSKLSVPDVNELCADHVAMVVKDADHPNEVWFFESTTGPGVAFDTWQSIKS